MHESWVRIQTRKQGRSSKLTRKQGEARLYLDQAKDDGYVGSISCHATE